MAKMRLINFKVLQNGAGMLVSVEWHLNGRHARQLQKALENLQDVPKASTAAVNLGSLCDFDDCSFVDFAKEIKRLRKPSDETSLIGLEARAEDLLALWSLD